MLTACGCWPQDIFSGRTRKKHFDTCIPCYSWKPKEAPYIPPVFSPPKQPPLPTNLRFKRADVVVDKIVDWWAPDAPFPYVDIRENSRTKIKQEVTDPGYSGSISEHVEQQSDCPSQIVDDRPREVDEPAENVEVVQDETSELSCGDRKRLEQNRWRNTK
ncbi:unnamed protein product [Allacma fusca]|uniref:Uncharacterized protein n=1 Tax=Allacma fusca TaxID=39272 RepID=A0A8J2LJ03_9HEXA|nr:unnamed protein product [Allacma fusca]